MEDRLMGRYLLTVLPGLAEGEKEKIRCAAHKHGFTPMFYNSLGGMSTSGVSCSGWAGADGGPLGSLLPFNPRDRASTSVSARPPQTAKTGLERARFLL